MIKIYPNSAWDRDKINDIISHAQSLGKPGHLRLSASDYSDFRKLGRDFIDISTTADMFKRGIMASIHGVCVVQRNLSPPGVISFFDSGAGYDDDVPAMSHVVNVQRWARSVLGDSELIFHQGDFMSCRHDHSYCLSFHVMMT